MYVYVYILVIILPFQAISIGSTSLSEWYQAAQVRVASPVCSAPCNLHQGPPGDSLVNGEKSPGGAIEDGHLTGGFKHF